MPKIPEIRSLDLDRRRLAVISVHATGFDPGSDRIIEVGVVMRKAFAADRTYHRRIDPGIPILPLATEVHGLADADVAGAPYFEEIAAGLARFLGAADLAGFGIRRLAVPLLEAEFRRVGLSFNWYRRSVVDLRDIYLHHEPHHLRGAVGHYLGRERPVAAGALAEAEASSRVLDAQLERHGDLPTTVPDLEVYPHPRDQLGLFRKESGFRPIVFAEGRHRGRTPLEVARIDPDYLESLLRMGLLFQARYFIESALTTIASEASPPEPLP
jgi:DNA polymerase III subunit epsilon